MGLLLSSPRKNSAVHKMPCIVREVPFVPLRTDDRWVQHRRNEAPQGGQFRHSPQVPPKSETLLILQIAESGRLGRAELLAKRGSIGQMQISAELVPIPDASRMRYVRIRPDASGCVGILNSSKFLALLTSEQNFCEFWQHSGKIWAKFGQNLGKNSNLANLIRI